MSRNIVIKGPRDINGNKREFYIVTRLEASANGACSLSAMTQPDAGAGIFTIIHVTAEEYRRLAVEHDISLNDEDMEALKG